MGLAACGASSGPPYEVTSSVVSGENTQEIGVWAPDSEGSWPVVFGFHGYGGVKEDWKVLATELARQGVVVFVPDYQSMASEIDIKKDLVCANQYAASVAGNYGADPDQPWTLVGHSLGASLVLIPRGDVLADTGGVLDPCIEGLPETDAIVAMEGCYYDSPDDPINDMSMKLPGIPVTLVAGEKDETCPPWQSENAAQALSEAGNDTTVVTIPGGTHGTPLFLDPSQDPWAQLPTDDPGGQATVAAILAAIESAQS
jgi:acetyl esterase/lipase